VLPVPLFCLRSSGSLWCCFSSETGNCECPGTKHRMECGMEVIFGSGSETQGITIYTTQESTCVSNWARRCTDLCTIQELEKLVMVAVCSFKVIINLTWVTSRELLHANIAKLITWVSLGPGQASVLS